MNILSNVFFLFFLLALPQGLFAFSVLPESLFPGHHAYKAYKEKNYTRAQKILEKRQVETPNDPELNYNLGTTYYRQKKYDAAQRSFQRAATHAFGKKSKIAEKAHFNLGNSYYHQTLESLGPNWEKERPDQAIITKSIASIMQAIEAYKKALSLDQENQKAQTNKKAAEELLQKLQQQKQDQKKDKQDQDKQDQDKQDKDKQDQDKQDQDKQDKDKQDKDKQKQDKDKQDKDKQDQDKQDKDKDKQKQDQDKQDQSGGQANERKRP